ncbi:MAG: hypothetical protein IIW46_03525, partial [Bacteroidaceae bacterium]|nr:hypothetical protein [Bacteroidaceae bacterium]
MKKSLLLILLYVGAQIVAGNLALLAVNMPNLMADKGIDEKLLLADPKVSLYALLGVYVLIIGGLYLTKVCRRE